MNSDQQIADMRAKVGPPPHKNWFGYHPFKVSEGAFVPYFANLGLWLILAVIVIRHLGKR